MILDIRMRAAFLASLLSLALASGCAQQPPTTTAKPGDKPAAETPKEAPPESGEYKPTKVADVPHLPNAYRLHEKVISGGQPDGEEAFKELTALGVKTVISVDGAKPEVELAKKYGLRYVHLPHGYDGVPEERGRELAKAVRDLPGPVYIHCHHGKHRSPAAATVACVAVGYLKPTDASSVLQTAGTGKNYRGLYQSAAEAKRLDAALLDNLQAEFPETAKLPAMAEAMVGVEHAHDHMKLIAAAGFKTPADHPALAPAHEALLLREHFTELLRADYVKQYGERFVALMLESETAAKKLEDVINADGDDKSLDLEAAKTAFDVVSKGCTGCHKESRDVPLKEKKH